MRGSFFLKPHGTICFLLFSFSEMGLMGGRA